MFNNYLKICVLGLFLIMISCDDQPQVINSNSNHIPSHTLSGWIKDADTAEPLAKIVIEIEEVDLQYQPLDTLKRVETDSNGFFLFPKLVPGSYSVRVLRNKHLVYQQTTVILHSHKVMDVAIPTPLATNSEKYAIFPNMIPFSGFFWKYAQDMVAISFEDLNTIIKANIYQGNFEKGFQVVSKKPIVSSEKKLNGFAFLDYYWTCRSNKIIGIHPQTGQVEITTELPYSVLDLTSDGQYLWATTLEKKILKFNRVPSRLIGEYEIPFDIKELGGIAWDGKGLWISDRGSAQIYHLNQDLEPIHTFKLFYLDQWYQSELVQSLDCLAFDFRGHLWAGDADQLFEFEIMQE